jgi:nicotinic acid mononucleotide adenylyltransferase
MRTAQALSTTQPSGELLTSHGEDARNRVGVLSGSFNPLTRAHEALADAAMVTGKLDVIVWVAPITSVNKEGVERASLVDRLLQMDAFTRGRGDALAIVNRGLYLDQAEILRDLQPQCDEFVMILGFDKIVQIFDPIYYSDRRAALDRLFSRVSALVAPRGDGDETALNDLLERPENQCYRGRITYCPLPKNFQGDSSTKARDAARSAAGMRRMRPLLAPEGRALADLPDVYAHVETGAIDRYLERQAIIARRALSPDDSTGVGLRLSELLRPRSA